MWHALRHLRRGTPLLGKLLQWHYVTKTYSKTVQNTPKYSVQQRMHFDTQHESKNCFHHGEMKTSRALKRLTTNNTLRSTHHSIHYDRGARDQIRGAGAPYYTTQLNRLRRSRTGCTSPTILVYDAAELAARSSEEPHLAPQQDKKRNVRRHEPCHTLPTKRSKATRSTPNDAAELAAQAPPYYATQPNWL